MSFAVDLDTSLACEKDGTADPLSLEGTSKKISPVSKDSCQDMEQELDSRIRVLSVDQVLKLVEEAAREAVEVGSQK